MAAIDKIYGSREQWHELRKYMKKNCEQYLKQMYPEPNPDNECSPICNLTIEADKFLYLNCPLDFVLDRLAEQHSEKLLEAWDHEKKG